MDWFTEHPFFLWFKGETFSFSSTFVTRNASCEGWPYSLILHPAYPAPFHRCQFWDKGIRLHCYAILIGFTKVLWKISPVSALFHHLVSSWFWLEAITGDSDLPAWIQIWNHFTAARLKPGSSNSGLADASGKSKNELPMMAV